MKKKQTTQALTYKRNVFGNITLAGAVIIAVLVALLAILPGCKKEIPPKQPVDSFGSYTPPIPTTNDPRPRHLTKNPEAE